MVASLEPVEGFVEPVRNLSTNLFGSQASSKLAWLFILPMAAVYAAAFAVPIVLILIESFSAGPTEEASGYTVANYEALVTQGLAGSVLLRTLMLSIVVTVVCAAIAYPVAIQMRRSGNTLRAVLLAMVVGPLLTSVIVRNVSWLLILGRNGIINSALLKLGIISSPLPLMYNSFGVVVAVVHVYVAFLVLPIYGALSQIDERIEESAASLGASPFLVFWRITFPLSLSGLIAGASLVFILSMGLYLTPTIMGGSFVVTAAMLITDLARLQYNWQMASAFAVFLLLAIGLALGAMRLIAQRVEKLHG